MHWIIQLLGALALTYFGASLFHRLTQRFLKPRQAIVVAHAASLLSLAAFAAITKAFLEFAREDAALVYVLPQLAWLVVDLVSEPRTSARR